MSFGFHWHHPTNSNFPIVFFIIYLSPHRSIKQPNDAYKCRDSVSRLAASPSCLRSNRKRFIIKLREVDDVALRTVNSVGSFTFDSRHGEHQSRHETVVH